MAKKNAREEPPKPQVSENEQMSDIVFILDKMELILEAVSQIGQDVRYGFLGKIHVAIVEASDLTDDGEIILSTSVGISPTCSRWPNGLSSS